MVSPITSSLTPRDWAMATALPNSRRDPHTSRISPPHDEGKVRPPAPGGWFAAVPCILLLAPALADLEAGVKHQAREEDRAVDAADAPVERQQQQQDGGPDHQRYVDADELARYGKRYNHGRNAKDEKYVEDVAADDVS